ncbi:hypothetical protein HHI36_000807 [Cryptolaemus montrouzieri]|uniref:Uncharacterized protein n=1 Tax=Cryptolaemus montrouzieri TaxID=559131 RepID=A0ABD2P6G1_9CUCU
MTRALKRPFREIPSFTENDEKYVKDLDKANKLASNFENIHTLPNVETDAQKDVAIKVKEFLRSHNNHLDDFRKIITNPEELVRIIKSLPNNKAPGLDEVRDQRRFEITTLAGNMENGRCYSHTEAWQGP